MGAAGSQLGRTLDVRLDLQDVTDPRSFGALLYTRAQGEVLCEDLGAACSLRLDDEDVIIIQLQRLQRSSVFHTGSDFAEVYLPWSKLRAELDGKEATLALGLEPAAPRLGRFARMEAYEAAYASARQLSCQPRAEQPGSWLSESIQVPQIRLRLSLRVSPGEDMAAVEARPKDCEALSSEDMKLLFQLQVWNRELRSELGERCVPQVEQQTEELVEQLRQSALERHLLAGELRALEEELSRGSARLTEAQLASLDVEEEDGLQPVAWDPERFCANIMEEVQKVTRQNIEISSGFEERIGKLEADLAKKQWQQTQGAPAWMLNQLQALETDCDLLEGELQEVQERRRQKQDRVLQRLRLENEVQKQEIDKLKDIIQQGREEKPTPPSTEPLEQQAAELRKEASALQLRRAGGQASVEQQSRALREEIAALEDRLQKTTSQKEVMEDVLEGLKCSHGSRELHRDQDLDKERVRSERRIQVLDTKILSLQQEAEDLRERASVVMKSKPPPDAILDSEVWRWQTAEQKQREVQELRREESKQQREQELALRDLEAAKVEASVLERKIRALGVQA